MEDGSTLSLLTPYPINSIYMAETETSPASIFGGQWERIQNRFLLGHGTTGYPLGHVGGEETHTLTVAEMPNHTHMFYATFGSNVGVGMDGPIVTVPKWDERNITTFDAGGGGSHNNMPPYYVVNIWKRVA